MDKQLGKDFEFGEKYPQKPIVVSFLLEANFIDSAPIPAQSTKKK